MSRIFALGAVWLSLPFALAGDPCKSGLGANQRPGPYSSLVCVGQQRGQQHCYICEAGDQPTVIIFARTLSGALGKLGNKLENALREHKEAGLRAWVTILAADQTSMDPKIVQWARQHAISNVPCGVFEDTVGPPTYLLARNADVTVMVAVKQKVTANFAFRVGELSDTKINEIMQAVGKVAEVKKSEPAS
jgi:hypothetical protein